MDFKLHAPVQPTGDQPEAIDKLVNGVNLGLDEQVLLGVTGSGKTFTMASVIEKINRRYGTTTLIITHNEAIAEMSDVVVRIKDGRVDSVTENAAKKTADEIEL